MVTIPRDLCRRNVYRWAHGELQLTITYLETDVLDVQKNSYIRPYLVIDLVEYQIRMSWLIDPFDAGV